MIIRSYGSAAVLAELDGAAEAIALRTALDAHPVAGLIDTMPGLRTVLVRFNPARTDANRIAQALQALEPVGVCADDADNHRQPEAMPVRVDYSGADLDDVAAQSGLSAAEVIRAHQAAIYQVVLIGMAPGFYFLAGGDSRLRVKRRASPRTDVPKGALGLAGDYTGIYPRLGPGGWQLIGRVLDELWHPTRLPAALLAPGAAVTFTAA